MNPACRFVLVASALCFPLFSTAARIHRCGVHHYPDSVATAYSVDSIRSYFSKFSADTVNIYRVRPEMWRDIPKTVRNFNKLYIFNEDGSTVQLHDSKRCANISMILEHNLPSVSNPAKYFETFISMCDPMTESTWKRDQFTAMIFWNRGFGNMQEDCPFEWARQLRFKYGNGIQIIWVNTDIADDGDASMREEDLRKMETYRSTILWELF